MTNPKALSLAKGFVRILNRIFVWFPRVRVALVLHDAQDVHRAHDAITNAPATAVCALLRKLLLCARIPR